MAEANVERPLGVSILAILDIICGILAILGGIALMALSAIIAQWGATVGLGGLFAFFEAFIIVLGLIVLVIGILAIAVGWGFWKGSGWAWIAGLILYIIGLITGVASLALGDVSSIVGIIIDALLVYYLFRPNVKAWFGRA